MKYPRVKALHFIIEHGPSIDYSQAESFSHQERSFAVLINDRKVRFVMRKRHATETEARQAVATYIDAWEFEVGLTRGPDSFKLRFDFADIEDLDPSTGVVFLRPSPVRLHVMTGDVRVILGKRGYPAPPTSGLSISPDVRSMYQRYLGYKRQREPLPSMVYFCLTVLETSTRQHRGGARTAVANLYRIDKPVLDRLGKLCSKKGGAGARKAVGVHQELSREETRFLEEAVKAIIRRIAEVAHNPCADLQSITMCDLPSI